MIILRFPPSVAHWLRKAAELIAPFGTPKLRWLSALNISALIWKRILSVIWVFLIIPKSTLSISSARKMLRPAVPMRCAAVTKLNKFGHLLFATVAPQAARISGIDIFEFIVPIKFGRIAFPTKPLMPDKAPAGSEPFSTVKGAPLWKVKNEFICQPPKTLPTKPCCSLKNGN